MKKEQDNSSTEQFVDTFFETTRRQILRQLVDTEWDNSSTPLFLVNWPENDNC